MEKREGLSKRNRRLIGISMAAITVIAASLIVVIVLMNKERTSDQQDTAVQQNAAVQVETTTADGWMEYVYETKWQDGSGRYYDTKEECLSNNASGVCKERKVLVDTIWHETE